MTLPKYFDHLILERVEKATECTHKPLIPCKSYVISTSDGLECDCDYPFSKEVDCSSCIVNGGNYDPRTGKVFKGKQ